MASENFFGGFPFLSSCTTSTREDKSRSDTSSLLPATSSQVTGTRPSQEDLWRRSNHATASLFPGSRARMQLAAPVEGQCARLPVPSCLAPCTSHERRGDRVRHVFWNPLGLEGAGGGCNGSGKVSEHPSFICVLCLGNGPCIRLSPGSPSTSTVRLHLLFLSSWNSPCVLF